MDASYLSSELESELCHVLEWLERELTAGSSSHFYTLHDGILCLLGRISHPTTAWQDAVSYCRNVIEHPQDSTSRVEGIWSRSCSPVYRELARRFGPGIIEAAQKGTDVLKDRYQGDALRIAHVSKRINTEENIHSQELGVAYGQPHPSVLAAVCYELTTFCCAVVQAAWLSSQSAVKSAFITNASICDDYHHFTGSERAVRLRMVALSIGAAYQLGGPAVNMLVDGTTLQARGTGHEETIAAALAWRAVGGGATGYSLYLWDPKSFDLVEHGLVAPEVMMATHDLFDWRSDAAAGNYENGVSAVLGLGSEDPFQAYLEAMLRRAGSHPKSGAHAIGGTVFLHFVSSRYGSYRYLRTGNVRSLYGAQCLELLKEVTSKAGFKWDPHPPPADFQAGEEYRELAKQYADDSWQADLHRLAQCGLSWFQSLLLTGQIQAYDALNPIDETMDGTIDWV